MRWRDRAPYTDKVLACDARFRPLLEAFLDALDTAGIPFALGDTKRDVAREWDLWRLGREVRAGLNVMDPKAWDVVNAKALVTRVPPGSGQGPHFWGLAADVYPLDITHRIMQDRNPDWKATISRMWAMAEQLGIDALGHKTDEPDDEYASWDPCHFQQLGWKHLIVPTTPV